MEADYLDEFNKEFLELLDSPIQEVGKYYSKGVDFRNIIYSMIEKSYDKRGLKELSKSTHIYHLWEATEKRLEKLSNAECFIMQIPD